MMNQQASNKLLKLIEEPPEKTFFILVSNNKQQLLPTISSRLQSIDIPSLPFLIKAMDVINWLAVGNNLILATPNSASIGTISFMSFPI